MIHRKSLSAIIGTVLLIGIAVGIQATGQNGGSAPLSADARVEAMVLQEANFEKAATPGKEADAIYGDIVLRNGFVSAVIAQPLASRNANMTVKDVGGALIDLSARGSSGGDQLAAFYPGKKTFPYRTVSVQDSAVTVTAEGTEERPEAVVTYDLKQQSPFVTITSVFTNRGTKQLTVSLEDDLRADGGKEEMVRSPNGTTDRFWLYDRHWGQAYGIDAEGYKLQLTSDVRGSTTTIKYENPAGQTSVNLAPAESFKLTRRIYPGATIFDVHAIASKSSDAATATFAVENFKTDLGNLALELTQGDTSLGVARFIHLSQQATQLPVGDYEAKLHFCGNALATREKIRIAPGVNQISLKTDVPRGRIIGHVVDTRNQGIPCKVEFKPLSEGAKLNFGPETGEYALRNLVYAPHGNFEQTIPAGKYSVTISHGPEFDIVQSEIDIKHGDSLPLNATLVRSVETPGWISSDFHSHSSPSGDNTSSQLGRVLNLVCEHVEFAPCTEHNRVSTYAPHIEALGISSFFSSVPGIELTNAPLPLSHQNAFPMKLTPRTQDNGAPLPGPDLESQIERLALWDNRSEKLVQVNHPDIGWMFYDKNGDGQPDSGFERAFPFMDVIEIHPIENSLHLGPRAMIGKLEFHNTIFNWLQLLNQGYRIYGVVNTDAHYNFHGSGPLRNWMQSSTDDPAKIDSLEMVHAAEQGRLVMSNGPYLEVSAHETGKQDRVVSGQDLKATSGKVTLKVRVQCPNWIDVNRLFVLVNGRPHSMHDYTREKHPDAFRSGVVKFDRTLDLDLKSDAHVVVVTGQVGGALGHVYGAEYGKAEPAAMTNPIFVDIDGNGFQPNKDTLDAPLPVKHPNSKL